MASKIKQYLFDVPKPKFRRGQWVKFQVGVIHKKFVIGKVMDIIPAGGSRNTYDYKIKIPSIAKPVLRWEYQLTTSSPPAR